VGEAARKAGRDTGLGNPRKRKWSASLWDIQKAIGRVAADTTILEAHFSMGVVTTMPYAAGVIVDTAKRLYGDAVAAQVRSAFQARGVL